MRRSIQFKAWDKQKKKWVCDWKRGIPAHYRGSQYPSEHGKVDYMCIYVIADEDFSECELCLFTGHKDKNGMGIYEGDILKGESGYLYTIKYLEYKGRFVLNDIYWDMDLTDESLGDLGKWEVVGNTYENPELIKKHIG